jgi:ATP-dependent DNA helicase RecG
MPHETQAVEFKSSWRDDWLKWICGFANAQGGVLEVGKGDDGTLVGLKDAQRLMEDVPNKITSTMGIVADVELKTEAGLNYVVVTVQPYSNAISYHGKYYMRSGATNRELNGSALVDFILRKQGRTWDSIPMPGVKVSDLDPVAFRDFRRKALASTRLTEADLDMSDAILLDTLLPAEDGQLTRAAVLAFHETPERFIRGCYVKVGRIDKDLLFYDEISGPLVSMVDRVLDTIYMKYFHQAIRYEGIYRVETYPVPRAALREAITNAVLHRDYSSPHPVQVNVHSDHITIYNAGSLPVGWTLADLTGQHGSWPRNPDLATVFFRSGQIEAWGRGIRRIQEACTAEGSPGPEYRTMGETLETTFRYNPLWLNSDKQGASPYAEDHGPKDRAKDRVTDTVKARVNRTQQVILAAMRDDPTVTAETLATLTGIQVRGVRKSIKSLRDAGLVDREGADRNGRWIVNQEAPND